MIAAGLAARLPALLTSLRTDEAYSAVHFIPAGPASIFDPVQYLPNNHLGFNLVEWGLTQWLPTSEMVLRAGGVIPALLAVWVVWRWGRTRLGRWVGLVAAGLLAVAPAHMEWSVQARGYGIGFLAVAGMVVGSDLLERSESRAGIATLALSATVGVAALPQLAFVFGGHLLVLLTNPVLRRRVAALAGGVGLTLALFYRPLVPNLLGQVDRVGGRFGSRVGPIDVLLDPAALLFEPLARIFVDGPGVVALVLFIVFGGVALARLAGSGDQRLGAHLLVPSLALMLALLAMRSFVLPRYISFLIVPIAIVTALAVCELLSWMSGTQRSVAVGALVVSAVFGVVDQSRELSVPWENYRDAASIALDGADDPIYVNRTSSTAGFQYYVSGLNYVGSAGNVCGLSAPVVLIDYPMEDEPLPDCLEVLEHLGHAPQRSGAGSIDVWLVQARDSGE